MRLALVALLACGGGAAEAPAPPEAPAPVEAPVPVPAPPPVAPAEPLQVLHSRVSKGRKLPSHVSATWVGQDDSSALQVMITGLHRACEPDPTFSLVMAGDQVRLVEAPFEAQGGCKGSHTLMLQLNGQEARDLTLTVVRADGSELGAADVGADDH